MRNESLKEYNEYWKGHKENSCIKLPKRGMQSRLVLFEKDLKDKKVLHFGCADWPYTEEKILNKVLLHQRLEKIARDLYGVDFSKEGIELMKKNGIKNLFIGDIYFLHEDKNFSDKQVDVIVASEIFEHLTNPGLALDSIKKYILKTNPDCEVIFTVPNYHNFWHNLIFGLRYKESVHYDHKFYFSYRTFRTLIETYSFEVDDFYFVTYGRGLAADLKGRIFAKTFSNLVQCLAPYLYFKCHVKNSSAQEL